MGQPLSLDDLIAKIPEYVDIELEDLGTVRIARMTVQQRMTILELFNSIERGEDGSALNNEHNVTLFIKMACKAIIGPDGDHCFDNEKGEKWLGMLEGTQFNQIVEAVMLQCGIGGDDDEELIDDQLLEASKND